MEILVVGSIALDNIKTPFGEVEEALGGSATHFSCVASYFSPVKMVGVIGNDFPPKHLELLKKRKINTSGLQQVEGKTFRWKGYYEYDLNTAHTIETQLNVLETFKPEIPEDYRHSKVVFLANIDPDLQLSVLEQTSKPKIIALDTMNYWIEHKKESLKKVISKVDFVLMNDSEARELIGTYRLIEAARTIISWGPKVVILKKGEHGALMFTNKTHFAAPAFPLEEIKDPTGAGDSFAGGFLGYLASTEEISDQNIRRAVIYGSVMASFNVEGFSVERTSKLSEEEIENRFRQFKDITNFEI